jgi:hypothetical protein
MYAADRPHRSPGAGDAPGNIRPLPTDCSSESKVIEEMALTMEERGANGDAAFRQSLTSLGDGDL